MSTPDVLFRAFLELFYALLLIFVPAVIVIAVIDWIPNYLRRRKLPPSPHRSNWKDAS